MKKVVYIVCSICIVLILIFCARRLFINKKGILLTAEMINFGSTDSAEDYWKKRVYNVYYDGTLKVYDIYNKSGKKSIKIKRNLTQTEINTIQEELSKEINKKSDASDGVSWTIKGYDKSGKINTEYSGYIYGMENFEHIKEILENNCKEE